MQKTGTSYGFSLIEMMIVVAIAAIIATIALPSYNDSVRKSRRVLAKAALLDLASREQRWYSLNNNYSTNAADLNYDAFPYAIKNDNGSVFYELSVQADKDKGFIATATAVSDQSKDACGNYSLDGLGTQSQTGKTTGCW